MSMVIPPATLPFAPQPLQVTVVSRDIDDGDAVCSYYLLWDRADGARCGRCPLKRCNRQEVPAYGVATCVQVLRGEASARFAASISVEA